MCVAHIVVPSEARAFFVTVFVTNSDRSLAIGGDESKMRVARGVATELDGCPYHRTSP